MVETVPERLIGRQAVADMFGCSPSTVDRLEVEGKIPRRRQLSGGRVAWIYSELVQAIHALPQGPLTNRTAAALAARGVDPAA